LKPSNRQRIHTSSNIQKKSVSYTEGHYVITHGKLLRYELQPPKNHIDNRANLEDWASGTSKLLTPRSPK
jgi:hypothetical protein